MNIQVDQKSLTDSTVSSTNSAGISREFRNGNTAVFIFKFVLFNSAAAMLVAAAWMQGWVQAVLFQDQTRLTLAISATFLVGLIYCSYKMFRLHSELKCLGNNWACKGSWAKHYLEKISDRSSGSRAITGSAFRMQIVTWIAPVRHFANSLVLLGLIGTVVGFIIALSGVDPETVSDVSQISGTVTTLLSGMSVALYTTLVGAVLNLWLMVNFHMLAATASEFIVNLIALGENHARA